jgi:hypothetical protein
MWGMRGWFGHQTARSRAVLMMRDWLSACKLLLSHGWVWGMVVSAWLLHGNRTVHNNLKAPAACITLHMNAYELAYSQLAGEHNPPVTLAAHTNPIYQQSFLARHRNGSRT